MSQQPEWQVVYRTDESKLEVDTTGVYPPELTLVNFDAEPPLYAWVSRIVCEPCTYEAGILSDNKYHPEHAVWFADKLVDVGRANGVPWACLVSALCSQDLRERAFAYHMLVNYFGALEFDSYPVLMRNEKAEDLLKE